MFVMIRGRLTKEMEGIHFTLCRVGGTVTRVEALKSELICDPKFRSGLKFLFASVGITSIAYPYVLVCL